MLGLDTRYAHVMTIVLLYGALLYRLLKFDHVEASRHTIRADGTRECRSELKE